MVLHILKQKGDSTLTIHNRILLDTPSLLRSSKHMFLFNEIYWIKIEPDRANGSFDKQKPTTQPKYS
jgi:hypothetical protein